MAGVGSAHRAGSFLGIECKSVGGAILEPEGRLEALLQAGGRLLQFDGLLAPVERIRQFDTPAIGGEGIGLYLSQRDRRLGKVAIGVEDRIAAVLPALVG